MRTGKLFLSAAFCLFHFFSNGQGQNNNWFLGAGKYVSFNSGSPVISSVSQAGSGTCDASMSDAAGNLLFYTGANVYDATHTQMSNGSGLVGNTIYNNVVITPYPGSPGLYYIFSSSGNLRYSIVDMSLNGGLGDITQKNITVSSPGDIVTITATKHNLGQNYWLVCRTTQAFSEGFRTFLVTGSAINNGPVFADAGANVTGLSTGLAKISDDGCWIARVENGNYDFPRKDIALYRFNNGTGAVSFISRATTLSYPGSLAFSADNSKLYMGQKHVLNFNASETPVLQPLFSMIFSFRPHRFLHRLHLFLPQQLFMIWRKDLILKYTFQGCSTVPRRLTTHAWQNQSKTSALLICRIMQELHPPLILQRCLHRTSL